MYWLISSSSLGAIADRLATLLPGQGGADVLQLRMALLSINSAVAASARSPLGDEEILAAARRAAVVLLEDLLPSSGGHARRPG